MGGHPASGLCEPSAQSKHTIEPLMCEYAPGVFEDMVNLLRACERLVRTNLRRLDGQRISRRLTERVVAALRVWNYNKSRIHSFRGARVIELAKAKDSFCGFEDGHRASVFSSLAPQLVPYSRHFCYEDGFRVGCREAGCIPFYSPCCGGAPGRPRAPRVPRAEAERRRRGRR